MVGGPSENTKPVLGLGTAMRNSSSAFIVAIVKFSPQYSVMAMIIVVYTLSIILMMIILGSIGNRTKKVPNTA
ncbi:MAG: hypothetical protein LLF83_09210 [Methanobacterium sp.]|nr:hypothetical protein [Methanobacterium sp.]